MAATVISRPSCRRSASTPADVEDDTIAESAIEDGQVCPLARRIEIGERRIDPHPRVDVDGLDAETDTAVEVIEIICPWDAERRCGIEAGTVEGTNLVVTVGAHGEPGEGSRECGTDRISPPTAVACCSGPRVVVRRAADRDNAAVMRRAAPDHAGSGKGDRLSSGELAAAVPPVVGGHESTPVEEIGRPPPRRTRPVVGPGLG